MAERKVLTKAEIKEKERKGREAASKWEREKRVATPEEVKEKNLFKDCGCKYYGVGGAKPEGAGPNEDLVSVKSGVELHGPAKDNRLTYDDTIQFKLKPGCKSPGVVQFVHRTVEQDGKLVAREIQAPNKEKYMSSTDPDKPGWHLDREDGSSAFFQDETEKTGEAAMQCPCDGLTVWDEPGLTPAKGEKWTAHFKTFFLCDGKVVGELDWSRAQEWKDGADAAEKAVYTARWVTDQGGMFDWVQRYLSGFQSGDFANFVVPGAPAAFPIFPIGAPG